LLDYGAPSAFLNPLDGSNHCRQSPTLGSVDQMQEEAKRDEVHESVRCGTFDSPYTRIQGLSQARCKAARSTSAA
jgi:hypothetical protein